MRDFNLLGVDGERRRMRGMGRERMNLKGWFPLFGRDSNFVDIQCRVLSFGISFSFASSSFYRP